MIGEPAWRGQRHGAQRKPGRAQRRRGPPRTRPLAPDRRLPSRQGGRRV